MRVLRYQLNVGDNVLRMGRSALLHVAIKAGESTVSMWATDHGDHFKRPRMFKVVATGQEVDGECLVYVGSALCVDREYVWHVFEDVAHVFTNQELA